VTGRIDPERFLDGRLPLDVDAARRAIADDVAARLGVGVEEAALAILEVATATMARALRVVTVGRGRDPAELPLVAFGGAGPLAAAALAQDVGAPAVLVPPLAGFVSALGLLSTDLRTEVARTVPGSGTRPVEEDALGAVAGPMVEEAVRRLGGPEGASVAFAVDCRYAGQGFELTVPLPTLDGQGIAAARTGFHAAHDAVFGHSAVEEPVEVVALRVIATAPGASFVPAELEGERGSSDEPASVRKVFVAGGWIETPVYERTALGAGWSAEGPLLVDEGESTAWVPRGWSVAVDAFGSMALEPTGGSGGR
jgi:N-methylhydantoinase A